MTTDFDKAEWKPILTVDVVPITIRDERLMVMLGRRKAPPFEGCEALIGGFVHVDEDADAAETAARVLAQKAGISGMFLEQLGTFSGATRDPRGWSASVAYFALVPYAKVEGTLGEDVFLRPLERPGRLPFDHAAIVKAALHRVRGKGAYSTLPARLLPLRFTLGELRRTYEIVMGEALDNSSFRRKMRELDIVEEIPGDTTRGEAGGTKRPSQAYRLKAGKGVFERRI